MNQRSGPSARRLALTTVALVVGIELSVAGTPIPIAVLGDLQRDSHSPRAPSVRLHALTRGGGGTDRLFAGTPDGLRTSRDRGRTWQSLAVNGSHEEVLSVALDPRRTGTLWVGRRDGLWRTDDGGRRWRAQPVPGDSTSIPLALALGPGEPQILYISAARHGVFRSLDGGQSWDPAGRGLPKRPTSGAPEDIRSLLVDPSDPDLAYAAHASHGVFRTRDGGAHWEPLNTGLPLARRWIGSPHLVLEPSGERVYLVVDQLVHSHLTQSRIYVLTSERWFPLETELPANDPVVGVIPGDAPQTLELWTESQRISVTTPASGRRQDR